MPENAPDSNGYPGTECCGTTDIMLTLAETYFGKLDEVWVQLERKQRLRQLQQRMTSGERGGRGGKSTQNLLLLFILNRLCTTSETLATQLTNLSHKQLTILDSLQSWRSLQLPDACRISRYWQR